MADEGKASGGGQGYGEGGSDEKRSLVENKRSKSEAKGKLAPSLRDDQITVVGIELDVPGQGRVSLRPRVGGGATSWDEDLSDAKVDRDPTDQFFDMDGGDMINDMDPTDPLRRPHPGPGPIVV